MFYYNYNYFFFLICTEFLYKKVPVNKYIIHLYIKYVQAELTVT